ncbi:MAG: aromatic ring-hydroxylating dioxygenase subunit alpha [Deltaproteobacteria bacterium]|nr:aromatic ring-hydroxylating dioxygenase subunit alpha [Deltaproteobacteria bacterium]MBT4068236.1 aromatic ring-hydroxylating dioxygenase subunit alpha [Candidatus Neomarinimicrobiota bacterium]MBT6637272.1 aromatic ring-hydroxylating dioxygenase subunit alpha [Candidatus Neomarinimicrobiota bacterium]
MNSSLTEKELKPPPNWDRSGLPAWTYLNDELFELEKEELFRRHWQIACHTSDIPEPGCYVTFDIVGERALILRDNEGQIRAFHNLCRHRGSRVVDASKGRCQGAIVCPFHGWSYSLDGTLRGAAKSHTLPDLDQCEWGLKSVEMEIWQGFVFVRFKPGPQPSIAKVLERFSEEVSLYRSEQLLSVEPIECTPAENINWKAIRDVDNEGYHVARAHPALHDLYGQHYFDEPFVNGVSRSYAPFNESAGRMWSVRNYKKFVDQLESPYRELPRAWLYIGIFPNNVLGFYPDAVMFYQDMPFSVSTAAVRGAIYKHPDENRVMRLARYLSTRIDAMAVEEDRQLTLWSFEATRSSAYDGILLSDLEYGVKSYHNALREVIPVMKQKTEPLTGTVSQINSASQSGEVK